MSISKTQKIVLVALTLFASVFTYAQVDDLETKQAYADQLFDVGEYSLAVKSYKELIDSGLTTPGNYYRYGLALVELYDPVDGLSFFQKAEAGGLQKSISTKLIQDEFDELYYSFELNFNLARGYHLTEEFDKSIKYYQKYIDLKGVTKEERVVVQRYLSQAIHGKKLKENENLDVLVENLGGVINSEYDDFGALVYSDTSTIIFTRKKPNRHRKSINVDGTFKEDIYITKIRRDGKWVAPYRISSAINKDHKDDFAVALNGDNNQLIIEYENGNLFESERKIQTWSKPSKLPRFINSSNEERGITITDDVMIVASDRPGTIGRLDLFVSWKDENGEWGHFQPMDTLINTEWNDCYPFLDPFDKTLYFSSQGHSSSGGYDIFKSRFNPMMKKWGTPENLGYPINTPRDDTHFTYHSNSNVAFYTSYKEGGYGGLDLYKVDYNHKASHLSTLCINVFSNDSLKRPLISKITVIDVEHNQGLNITTNGDGKVSSYTVSGKEYKLNLMTDGYFMKDTVIFVPEAEDTFYVDIPVDPMIEGEVIILQSVSFERDKSKLNIAAYNELNMFYDLLTENNTLAVEIAGHTEIGGATDKNKKLSQDRADAVKEYLIRKGINPKRLLSTGYGAKYPLSKGTTEQAKAENRRTEIILHIQSGDSDNWTSFYDGE